MAKGSTRIDFRGTALMPQATGQAKVEAKNGAVLISANFDNLSPAGQFGGAYLTYVLWAITPEGRANNLGQLLLDGAKSKVQVTTRLQTFGLMVTAEPYYAVSFPSEEVVLENFVRPDTKGKVDAVDAKYDLLQRSRYKDLNLAPLDDDPNVPLDFCRRATRSASRNPTMPRNTRANRGRKLRTRLRAPRIIKRASRKNLFPRRRARQFKPTRMPSPSA